MGPHAKITARLAAGLVCLGCLLGGVCTARADGGRPAIYGGAVVEPCGWPSAVSLDVGTCTGTLVHPGIVVTAAHCLDGAPLTTVEFGDDFRDPERQVSIVACTAHPKYPELGFDIAVCELATPVTDVPIVPMLYGCEVDAITLGQAVTIVGYGVANDELGDGPKRAVTTDVRDFEFGDVVVGGDCRDSCFGDSGGPVFIQLDDGTWRAFGVTSEGLGFQCGGGGVYTQMHEHRAWLEATAGVDLTPCHADDGTWSPGAECGEAPTAPDRPNASASWNSGCGPGATLTRTEVCTARPGELTPDPPDCRNDPGDDGGTTFTPMDDGRGDDDEGCSCRAADGENGPLAPLMAALGGLLLVGVRRPRRASADA